MAVTVVEDSLLESVKSDFIEYLRRDIDFEFDDNTPEEAVDRFELLKKNGRIKDIQQRDYNYWFKRDPYEFFDFIKKFTQSNTEEKISKNIWCRNCL